MILKNAPIKFSEINGAAFRMALDATPNGQLLIDHNGMIIYPNSMIDGILNYSRIGRVEEFTQAVNAQQLVNDTIETLNLPPHIHVRTVTTLPEINCVAVHIVQIFQNLISNAARYMDKKEGLIEIGHENRENEWLFFVRDNGPGIEPQHFDRIFKIFQTLAVKDDLESTGIGLSIVKKVVELHGGHVWLESQSGKGTTFFFTIAKNKKNENK